MTDLIWYVFSVGGAVTLMLAAALWLVLRPSSHRARQTLIGLLVAYALASTYALGHAFDRLLVIGFEPFTAADVPAGATALIVLGSGSFTAVDWDERRVSVPDGAASMRVLEAVRVFRLTGAQWIISSGGQARPDPDEEPTGQTMRDALVDLGVPADRILVEVESRNTHEEALIVARMLSKLAVRHTVLITSDIHMRRSLGAFRAAGVYPIPAIARHRQESARWLGKFLPSDAGLGETALAMHEVFGLAYYVARGWYE